jgi:phenylacetyl-CoA:acceptor oxidoreductase subunit 2
LRNTELLLAARQTIWGRPASANFILGGAGAGLYLFSFITGVLQDGALAVSKPLSSGLVGPVLVALGFLALAIEAGRPLRGIHLFRHLRRSWISRETLFAGLFISAAVIDRMFPDSLFRIVAAAAGLGLMVSQGFILFQAKAITAWNVPLMPLFFTSSGFTSGGAVSLLIGALTKSALSSSTIVLVMIALSTTLVIWLLYLYRSRGIAFREATEELRRPFALIVTLGFGHMLPLVLLFLAAARADSETNGPFLIETAISLAILIGVIWQKGAIVLSVSHMKEIRIGANLEA